MNKIFAVEELTAWVKRLKDSAADDEQFLVSWFLPTKDSPIAIVGGWQGNYDSKDADLFCMSVSNPTYAMCIKIVINNGPYAYADFEVLDMPTFANGEVDDTSLTLEWEDNPEAIAKFYIGEWERISDANENGLY